MASPGDYQYFKATVPEQRIFVGLRYQKLWRYYDYGPKSVPPVICIPGAAGTADVFYKQILAVSAKGYRIMAVDAPAVWSHQEWTDGFEKFLDCLRIHQVHLYGTSLGGLLAQLFAQYKPRRVKSLLLSNTFLDTRFFNEAFPWSGLYPFSPEFMLKGTILSGFRKGPHEPLIADSIDFVVSQLDTLGRAELASRLTLNTTLASVDGLTLPDECITIMDTNDYSAVPSELRDEVQRRYGGARRALLKSGGDFPFLSRADEVCLHILLHLRRVGLEVEPPSQTAAASPSSSSNHARRASTGSMYGGVVPPTQVVHKLGIGKGGGPSYGGNQGEKLAPSVPRSPSQPLPLSTPVTRRDPFIRVDNTRSSTQHSRSPPLSETSPSGSGRDPVQEPWLSPVSSTSAGTLRGTVHSQLGEAEEKREVLPNNSLRKVLEGGSEKASGPAALKHSQGTTSTFLEPLLNTEGEEGLREGKGDADSGGKETRKSLDTTSMFVEPLVKVKVEEGLGERKGSAHVGGEEESYKSPDTTTISPEQLVKAEGEEEVRERTKGTGVGEKEESNKSPGAASRPADVDAEETRIISSSGDEDRCPCPLKTAERDEELLLGSPVRHGDPLLDPSSTDE